MKNLEDFGTGTTLPAWTSDAEATMGASPDAGCCPEWDEEFAKLLGPGDVSDAYAAHFEKCWRCQRAYGIEVESAPAAPDPVEDEPTREWVRPAPPVAPAAFLASGDDVPRLTISNWTVAAIVAAILGLVAGGLALLANAGRLS